MRISLALIFFLVVAATAATATQPPPTVTAAWSRATPPGLPLAVVYLDIVGATTADTLLRLETPIAARAELHSSSTDGGIMRMRPVASVAVSAKSRVRLEPGGLHGMLIELKQPLVEGERFPLTLVFERSGAITVDVVVKSIGAASY